MPYSDPSCRRWILAQLLNLRDPVPESVVDVGAGAGTAKEFYGPWLPADWTRPRAPWTAIEIWEPYVARFALNFRYQHVIRGDARELVLPEADLYLFCDVVEHMPPEDAIALWARARKVARWLVINLPVHRYEQGEMEGNPFEAHVYHWSVEEVLATFPGIVAHTGPLTPGSLTGAFIAEGEPRGG